MHYTERLARETEGEIQKRTVEYIRYKLENKSNNDPERNTKSDSDDEPAEDDPRSTSPLYEPAAGELIFITDCYNFPYRDKPPPPTDPAFKTWSPPDPRTTNSLDAFFKHYFCYNHPSSDYWTANRKKTPHPIILCSVTNHNEIHARAKCISGLQTCSAGASPNYVIVMGWDRLTVWRRASEVIAASYSEHPCRYIFDTARNYALAMEGCHDGPLRKKADNWTENAVRGRLDHFQGSYLVRWKEIGGGWDVRAVLKLDIGMGPTKDILGAKLRFLGTEERMLLAHSEEMLDTYLDMFLKKKREGQDHKSDKEPADKPIEKSGMINDRNVTFIVGLCYCVLVRTTAVRRGKLHWNADQTFTSFTGDGYLPYLANGVEMEGFEC
ncbi:hypothetical protein SLS60_003517 [Paraconiothyrium brasiliense]|uniref:Uncharacterized protein n=1 Tax=Paraconiothyrium brasiliense TaxID=300254 RepID=A0ABR3RVW9_9PLEO